jgi:hypothetical protein
VECNKLLHRAKKIAKENERFYYWFELLNWEKMLLEEAYESGEFTKDLDALIEEERDVIEKLRNLAAYHILYSKINYVFRSGGYVRTDEEHAMVEEISEHQLIKGKNTALSSGRDDLLLHPRVLSMGKARLGDQLGEIRSGETDPG